MSREHIFPEALGKSDEILDPGIACDGCNQGPRCRCSPAGLGAEVVRVAVEREADVALLDIEMPRLDGFGAATEIRRLRPGTLLFLHTGSVVDDSRRRGSELSLRVFRQAPPPTDNRSASAGAPGRRR